ncbi:MAG TPA: phosphotransferase [Amycolatopsis sp.]|uniref:phosphotransferase enzyme family protein n=1 Tax=Amycolatopsis sp. TaxID=37632 RepID=UPI002B4898DA|nr:phosphotransferase [Amycolatopsis sp.]HKS50190.1 phosphotransferase [Amycolatopsis sp.]
MITDTDVAKRVVARALGRYGVAGDPALTFVKYRENYVFRLDEEAGSYAVRLHRHGYRSDAEILEELALVSALDAAGVAVPRIRPTTEGELFCLVADDDADVHQVDMLEWIPDAVPLGDVGEAFLGEAAVDPVTFHALGVLIAGLHTTAATLKRDRPHARPSWDADGLVGEGAIWGDPRRAFHDGTPGHETVDRAISLLRAELEAYGTAPDRYGPIHADFTPENVLADDGGRLSVIDFDDSGDGYYLFDLATAAFFYLPHPRIDDVVSALMAGYQSVRPLTPDDLVIWRPLLLARGLTYLGWAADRRGDETATFIFEHLRPLVVDLAAQFIASTVSP